MKCEFIVPRDPDSEPTILRITPENSMERYALKKWSNENVEVKKPNETNNWQNISIIKNIEISYDED